MRFSRNEPSPGNPYCFWVRSSVPWPDFALLLAKMGFALLRPRKPVLVRSSVEKRLTPYRAILAKMAASVPQECHRSVLRPLEKYPFLVSMRHFNASVPSVQPSVRRDYDPWHDVPLPRNLDKPEKDVPLEPEDEPEHMEEQEAPADNAADYVQDFKVFMTKVKAGTFSALNVSFENSKQILELSTPSCSITHC